MEQEKKSFSDGCNAHAAEVLASKVDGLQDVTTECLYSYVIDAIETATGSGDIITILELPPRN